MLDAGDILIAAIAIVKGMQLLMGYLKDYKRLRRFGLRFA